jgi:hypothetical protein
MKHFVIALTTALCIAIVCSDHRAYAGLIFNNGTPDLLNGMQSDLDAPNQVSDAFDLTTSAFIDSVIWYGLFGPDNSPEPIDFSLLIYKNDNGLPSVAPVLSTSVSPVVGSSLGKVAGLFDVYQFVAAATISLPAGAYFLSVLADTANDTNDQWFWATSNASGGSGLFRSDAAAAWSPRDAAFAFSLQGTVTDLPEPSSTAALLLGLAAAALITRRRKRG